MSYDLEILAKIENGDYICIAEPRYSSPTYNLGKMFRIAMDWDFDQGTIYNIADIVNNIQRGISELEQYPGKYVQYEPENRWGTVTWIPLLERRRKAFCNHGSRDFIQR